jgi:hypothetical protein
VPLLLIWARTMRTPLPRNKERRFPKNDFCAFQMKPSIEGTSPSLCQTDRQFPLEMGEQRLIIRAGPLTTSLPHRRVV